MLTTHIRMFCNLVPRLQTAHKPYLIGRPIWFDPHGRESLKKMDFPWKSGLPGSLNNNSLGLQAARGSLLPLWFPPGFTHSYCLPNLVDVYFATLGFQVSSFITVYTHPGVLSTFWEFLNWCSIFTYLVPHILAYANVRYKKVSSK